MNRELKFRAWDTEEKQMIYFFHPSFFKIENCIGFGFVNNYYDFWHSDNGINSLSLTDRFIPLQFTGLRDGTKWDDTPEKEKKLWLYRNREKDWNGREIYEGHVIEFTGGFKNSEIYVVEWDKETHEWKLHNSCQKADVKIIGNIFENPELLKMVS
jgi:hypothetical protein